jgi:excisionase family DNA binding protein
MNTKELKDNPILRATEVCKLVGIGRNTLYEWCRLNIIPYKRVGRLSFSLEKKFLLGSKIDWEEI